MDSTKREYPFVYVYMTESIDGIKNYNLFKIK